MDRGGRGPVESRATVAILISVQNLEKSFGSHQLFRSLSFGLETGDRAGLIGPNGAGKSTLLKILANRVEADRGEIARPKSLRLGYLDQSPEFPEGLSVYDAVAEAITDVDNLAAVSAWLAKLDLAPMADQEVARLSGGWRKRVALGRELARDPDLLLLDEPTNHLDLESILWLEKFLQQQTQLATLTVTHDRMFLQRVSNRIFDLDKRNPDGLLVFAGSYDGYLEAKQGLLAADARREETLKNKLRRETEWLRRGAKARITKQQARIDRAGQLAEQTAEVEQRRQNKSAGIEFHSAERNPTKLIEAKAVEKSFGDRRIFGPLDLIVSPKTRLGLLGRNGSGKTTLIRVLLGEIPPDKGTVKHAEKLQVAYFSQHREELDPKKSVLRSVCPDGDYVHYRGQPVFARSYLSRFLFRTEQMDMPTEKLSGGEKARLRIAQLMLLPANMLVLDEPTNDLDLATLDVLEDSLREFDGAVILVTHDRYFLDQVANEILAFTETPAGEAAIERFADTLQWEAWLETAPKSRWRDGAEKPVQADAPVASAAQKKKRLSYKDQRELDGMEETIQKAEARLAELQAESARPENLANSAKLTEIFTEISALQAKIEALYLRWAELEG